MECLTSYMHSIKAICCEWESGSKWNIWTGLNTKVISGLQMMEDFSGMEILSLGSLSSQSTHLLWFSFRSLDSWTSSSGLETYGLFSRRLAGIPLDSGIFLTPWRNTPAATVRVVTTKIAMGQVVGIASRPGWSHPQRSLASSLVVLLPLLIRFKRATFVFFWR